MILPINSDDMMTVSEIMHQAQLKISEINPYFRLEVTVAETTSEDIDSVVNKIYTILRLPRDDSSRKPEFIIPRNIVMYYLVRYKRYSLKAVGSMFGNKDHSTVIHGVKEAQKYIDINQFDAINTLDKIRNLINQ